MHTVTFSHSAASGIGKNTSAPVTVSPTEAIIIHGLNLEPLLPMRTPSIMPPIMGSLTPSHTLVRMMITDHIPPGIPMNWV